MARFFIDRPVFAWVIAILIMMAGGISIFRLPVDLRNYSRMQIHCQETT